MKNKSYIVLLMYDAIRMGVGVKIDECCGRYDISVATFRRHVAFLRAYFMEQFGQNVVYDSSEKRYRLESA